MKKITILKVLVPLVCWLSSNGWITLGYEDTIPHSNLRQLWKAILPSKLPLRRARYLYVCAAVLLLPILNPASFLFLPLVFIPKAVLINCLHTTLHYIGCFSGTQSRKRLYSIFHYMIISVCITWIIYIYIIIYTYNYMYFYWGNINNDISFRYITLSFNKTKMRCKYGFVTN